tara:strand:- start:305 stop:793 length:489 start_codon:yes stop_codon:yes gene_type:complete
MRKAFVERKTKETKISSEINIDGIGDCKINTGIGFLDHMLEQIARHGLFDIQLSAEGDLYIDGHHTTEDTGYVVGAAISKALGERKGIERYGNALIPMDETLTRVVVDLSGRPYLIWNVAFTQKNWGIWIRNSSRNGFKRFLSLWEPISMWKIYMELIITIL